MKQQLLLGAALCAFLPLSAHAGDPVKLPEVLAEDQIETPQRIILNFEEDSTFPAADGGDYLQSVPGVSGSRMGSHGIDPFIRGQKQTQLNIVDDGVFVQGGCPNRMDPPASFLSIDGNDELIVEKGYTSVQHGSGGSGGTVKTKRNAPTFTEGKSANINISGGIDSNGNTRDVAIKGSFDLGDGHYVRANIEKSAANSYEDGNGKKVRSGFDQHGGRLDVGVQATADTKITFGAQLDDTSDALYAGAGMDAPEAKMMALRSSLTHKGDFGLFNQMNASAYISQVDHIMDNFSLRSRAGMGMLTESDTQIYGGTLSLENNDLVVGADLKVSYQDALRYMGAQTNIYASGNEQAYMWPGMSTDQIGLFGEKTYQVSSAGKVKVGLRYDYVGVDANKVNTVSARTGRTANQLYQMYYGKQWDDQSEHNIGGLLRYDHELDQNIAFYGSLSRVVRTADATERGMAGDHATAGLRWIGNPDIDPEQHHQVELGASAAYDGWNVGGSVYYNKVSDYILRDNATGQDGILLADNADIYRNIDATLMGFELSGGIDLMEGLNLALNVAYTYGENDEDNRPLAQIAPLEVGAALEYSTADWMSGLRMRAAAKQNRADIGAVTSGQDIEKTGGYAVFDVYGKIWAFKPFDLALGVTNVLDKTYSNHLNRGSSFDNTVAKVNEPGRSFFLRVNADF
ncbi:TonB-dependent receptor domain-containing protein [Terasakiella sp.]|uniref:TonB-dependent receptor domain-containing protein n=1 Tax=Terasakiella sp. TaxID=2034861 RepID=UPI003AA91791